jgi:hypothetical protein
MWPGRQTWRSLRRNPARRRRFPAPGRAGRRLLPDVINRADIGPVDVAHAAGANLLQFLYGPNCAPSVTVMRPRAGNDCKRIVWRKSTSLRPRPPCANCAENTQQKGRFSHQPDTLAAAANVQHSCTLFLSASAAGTRQSKSFVSVINRCDAS